MNPADRDGAAAVLLLARKFPQHEMLLHRLYRQDEEFRLLCDDHFEAVQAFEHWCAASDLAKTEEYRQLAEEYAAMIFAALVRKSR